LRDIMLINSAGLRELIRLRKFIVKEKKVKIATILNPDSVLPRIFVIAGLMEYFHSVFSEKQAWSYLKNGETPIKKKITIQKNNYLLNKK
ncbi:MAG: hypothetical protein KKA19_04965, partial [Candidatus Margulisbacteria bacterium]|nr:hypothetical protein [Candidatus Margulisiibacteriota bacterium]